MLGEEQLRKWISLVAVVGAAQESCGELVRSALVRARFCELLSHKANRNPTDLFLMGLLSHIDAILGTPMADILRQLPLSDDVKAALLRQASRLSQVYDLVLAYETANWTWCADLASGLHCTEREIAGFYFDAVQWARHITTF
jgi:c-di-GMP-related signal transduction protein